jgi:hypothetical protein
VRRSPAAYWIGGVVLLLLGSVIDGLYADREAACQSSLGVAAQSNATTTGNCVLSFVAVHLGQAILLIGLALLVVAAVLTILRPKRGPGSPGWYTLPGSPAPVFWDGDRWVK